MTDGRPGIGGTSRTFGGGVSSRSRASTATEELRTRVDERNEEDEMVQEEYGVPEPDAVSTDDIAVDDHETLHGYGEDLSEWRTVRRDIRMLRRAVERVETSADDGVRT